MLELQMELLLDLQLLISLDSVSCLRHATEGAGDSNQQPSTLLDDPLHLLSYRRLNLSCANNVLMFILGANGVCRFCLASHTNCNLPLNKFGGMFIYYL